MSATDKCRSAFVAFMAISAKAMAETKYLDCTVAAGAMYELIGPEINHFQSCPVCYLVAGDCLSHAGDQV
jgi:hypothetical protein